MLVCKHRFISICLLFSLFFAVAPTYSQSETFKASNHYFDSLNTIYKMQQLHELFLHLDKEKHFNGSLLIARGDTILYENVCGYIYYPDTESLNLHTSFEIASITKTFTAVAILLLYEEGKLDINRKVSEYLPNFPYKDISIHDLLCHRSGLPAYFSFAKKYHDDKMFPLTNDSLLAMMQHYTPRRNSSPGQLFEYSNTGYAVLASIIEKVSEVSYIQFIQTKLLIPLDLHETYVYRFGEPENIILGHKSNKRLDTRNFLSGVVGDKGIQSSASDLYKWTLSLFSEKIISRKSLDLLSTPKNPELSRCNNYGYGFRISCDEQGNSLFFHGGLWNGNHSLLVYRPFDQTIIVVLSNIYNKSFFGISGTILSILDEW